MKSIGIQEEVHERLKRYCDRQGLKHSEFILTALQYFEKHGINPATHESPGAEMQQLVKRLDQVVAFIRKQESTLLRPLVESVSLSEGRIEQSLNEIGTRQQLEALNKNLVSLVAKIDEHFKRSENNVVALISKQASEQLKALTWLGNLIDAKQKTGFLNDLGSLYDQAKGGGQ